MKAPSKRDEPHSEAEGVFSCPTAVGQLRLSLIRDALTS